MTKKIGFDATSITENHTGGKNQVPLNLLRGFEKNGVAEDFVIFCRSEMKESLSRIIPHATFVPISSIKLWKDAITEIFIRTFVIPRYINRRRIGVLLFPIFNTGFRSYRIPTVVIPHDVQTQTNKDRFPFKNRLRMSFHYHFDFKLRDRIVAISNFDREEISKAYPLYQNKIVQIYNPIFTDIILSAGIQRTEQPYIAAVNIQFRHKNIITLIKAFERIRNEIPHHLYLIGRRTPETASISSYVRDHNLNDRVLFTGFLDDTVLAEVLKGSSLYVNPSLFEGFGMTAVEAMLAGVPVLVSKVSAVPEVTMGLCHYYEPPDDAEALAGAMKNILLEKRGFEGGSPEMIRTKICEKYDYTEISRQYFELLTSLIRKEGP